MNYWRNLCMTWKAKIQSLLPIVEVEPMYEEDLSSREWLIVQLLEREARHREESAACQLCLNALGSELQVVERRAAELREEIAIEQGRRMAKSFEHDAQVTKLRAALAECSPVALETLLEQVNVEIEHAQRASTMEEKVINRLATLRRVREQALTLRSEPIEMARLLTQLKALQHTCGLTAA